MVAAQPETKIGLLAGEASGDNLGAGLMAALRKQTDLKGQLHFMGVGGTRMLAQGLAPLADMDELAVNGFKDPILRLPKLIRLLRHLIRTFVDAKIDVFVGVDFNVFNFILEAALKKRGIKTVHYVSPSVYAWRAGRTKRVAKSADVVLCLYPFEPAFYEGLPVTAEFVGHPLADDIAADAGALPHKQAAREQLQIDPADNVLAVLPGSRGSEVDLMIAVFLDAAERFCATHTNTRIVIPCLRPHLRTRIEQACRAHPDLPVVLHDGNARLPLLAADIALVKSGTSTLETMLLHRPMVVSYRLGALTYQLAKRVVHTPFVALPNILAGRELVPELIQDAATGEALAAALQQQWRRVQAEPGYLQNFTDLHEQLAQGADAKAAGAVVRLLKLSS